MAASEQWHAPLQRHAHACLVVYTEFYHWIESQPLLLSYFGVVAVRLLAPSLDASRSHFICRLYLQQLFISTYCFLRRLTLYGHLGAYRSAT